jgi:hypothetical protein
MAENDKPGIPLPPPAAPGLRCPWCSTPVESLEDATCVACGATLHGNSTVEIPGVTAIDSAHASRATAPRKTRRTFGSLFVGGDDGIPPPSQAELPALAMPDPEVRREMLRLQLDAELADLTARAAALAAERGIAAPVIPRAAPEPDASPKTVAPTGVAAGGGSPPPATPDTDAATTGPTPDGALPIPEAAPGPEAAPPGAPARPGRGRARRPRA